MQTARENKRDESISSIAVSLFPLSSLSLSLVAAFSGNGGKKPDAVPFDALSPANDAAA